MNIDFLYRPSQVKPFLFGSSQPLSLTPLLYTSDSQRAQYRPAELHHDQQEVHVSEKIIWVSIKTRAKLKFLCYHQIPGDEGDENEVNTGEIIVNDAPGSWVFGGYNWK
ncbi:hypothetical protein TNCV_3947371 [Trichonephila clavipes]|nr:hypothetical protein TNCV_3947371 [Trichonephila clavipes]